MTARNILLQAVDWEEKRAVVRGIGGTQAHPLRFKREQYPLGSSRGTLVARRI